MNFSFWAVLDFVKIVWQCRKNTLLCFLAELHEIYTTFMSVLYDATVKTGLA